MKKKSRSISKPNGDWTDWLPKTLPEFDDPTKTIRDFHVDEDLNFDDETVCALCGRKADCKCHYYRCDKCSGYTATCSCHHDVCNDCEDVKYFCVCKGE